ncbi:hypothetical protein XELAEV_18046825mg [Xenopus laevis]|uniref:Uncharacterized protein n=1 Tax=Xenopus laevis TaxID=8355 RepID=A0A974BU40_XENLA|nr:hypothetical protein XELAEV_18046825mg [Xenopus laevis]
MSLHIGNVTPILGAFACFFPLLYAISLLVSASCRLLIIRACGSGPCLLNSTPKNIYIDIISVNACCAVSCSSPFTAVWPGLPTILCRSSILMAARSQMKQVLLLIAEGEKQRFPLISYPAHNVNTRQFLCLSWSKTGFAEFTFSLLVLRFI